MLNDIKQTPDALKALLEAHIDLKEGVKGISMPIAPCSIGKIYIIASGSSRNAANAAKCFIEKITKLSVIVDFAGEFAHGSPVITSNDLLIPLSQSGETADVLAALNKGKSLGIPTFSVTNNIESAIHKLSDNGMVVHAGKEESIPATKSFTCQLMSLYILGIYLAEGRNTLSSSEINTLKQKLLAIPEKISANIDGFSKKVCAAASRIKDSNNLIIIGRGQNSALADECALKTQETSYINAFGYPSGEFMHGHLAVLDENSPVISLLTRAFDDSQSYNLSIKNTREIKSKRNPVLIAIGHDLDEVADVFIAIEDNDEVITPFLTILIIQLLTFEVANLLGRDVSKPRSLNKTVLSE